MKQEHHPKAIRLNNIGANASDERIYVGAGDAGFYLNSHNGRVSSLDGKSGDWEKIKGEVLDYSEDQPGDWYCIGAIDVKGMKFTVWVDDSGVNAPLIMVDNQVVCQSADLPFQKEFPLQMDANQGCEKGEVFLTDGETTPLYFDIKDMLDNILTQKYFGGFNYSRYTVNLDKPLDIPVFIELVNVGGSGGLPVGTYQYGIAYVTKSGDRTAISEKTPPIPVVRSYSEGTRVYPYVKTFGDSPNPSSKTSYGPKIRFRVTNDLNFDSIEIIRFDYNSGQGLNFTPNAKVVGRVSIEDGQIDIVDFVDPVDSDREIPLSVEEETQQSYLIKTAKGIKYYGSRVSLANVTVVDKEDTSTFMELNDKKIFPILEELGVSGHNEPYHHAYRSSEMGGEKTTYGVHFWDSTGGRTFVKEDLDLTDLLYPNRRDLMDIDSQNYSFSHPVLPNVNGVVSAVFESYDHVGSIRKGDKDNFKNILKKGSRTEATVDEDTATNHEDYQAADGSTASTVRVPYLVWKPTDSNDMGDSHDMLPNVQVDSDGFGGAGNKHAYDPKCFALNYYAKGHALTGLDNIPDWVKSFSVVRTEKAGRVVCQGLGMYKINPGSYNGTSADKVTKKDNGSMWFFSPDIDSGIVSQAEIDNIKQNPNDYKVQFVSPQGFFSETYSFESNSTKDHLVDIITHARIQRDQGEINPGTDPTSTADGYVYYNKYRGIDSPLFDINEGFFSGSNGNKEMGIDFFNEIKEGRGSFFHLGFTSHIYGVENVGGTGKRDFDDVGLKNWTEPFYMVNIIKTGASAPNGDIQGFKSTGTHIKIESIIGIGNNNNLTQEFELVDERWEDCCKSVSGQPDDVYIYLRDINTGDERIFYDITNSTILLADTIRNDITNNGFWLSPSGKQVVGVYNHENLGLGVKKNHDFVIKFNDPGYFPTDQEYIIVKYDNRTPIRFFGGDTFVGDSIFCPIDKEIKLSNNTEDPEETTQFVLNVGFPYGRYKMNPRYYRTKNTTAVDKIQNTDWHSFSHIRQMAVLFTCDARTAIHYAHNESYPNEYYPLIHYVMRPNVWDDAVSLEENNIFSDYEVDYPGEFPDRFQRGGIRFIQNFNIDYSSRGRLEFFSKPSIGFEEKFEFCNLVIWSLPRATNQQDSPGLKTFLTGNSFEIEDSQGEIKFLYAATYSDKGSNMYAITERGVCLLLTEKSILSNVDANFLTSVASDRFIGQQFWIEREIGSTGEFWRGKATGTIPIKSESGDAEMEILVFPNDKSVYMLMNNQVKDIGDIKYLSEIKPKLKSVDQDRFFTMTGIVDEVNNEYWLQIDQALLDGEGVTVNFKFSFDTFHWVGTQDYKFDKYLYSKGVVYGMRDLEVYRLDEGFIINGEVIESWIKQVFSKDPYFDKEFIRIGVETGGREGEKPTKIQFEDQNGMVIAEMSQAAQGINWLLRYDAWEHFIPRRIDNDNRLQNQLVIYKIIHNLASDFKVVNTTIQYKVLK